MHKDYAPVKHFDRHTAIATLSRLYSPPLLVMPSGRSETPCILNPFEEVNEERRLLDRGAWFS
jgi:hypothetical protein